MLRVQKTIFVMLILAIVIANPTLVVTIVKSVLMDFLDSQPVKVCSDIFLYEIHRELISFFIELSDD